tara:strand:- start:373 stop:558 length:186 start_codon:yes stop_codon:yes gene_type:complete
MSEHIKIGVDIGSITLVGATLVDMLPAIAAVFSILWSVLRIMETKFVKNLRSKWRKIWLKR